MALDILMISATSPSKSLASLTQLLPTLAGILSAWSVAGRASRGFRGPRCILGSVWIKTAHLIFTLVPQSTFAQFYRCAIFRSVYQKKLWGTDDASEFFSGSGSHSSAATAYADAVSTAISQHHTGRESNLTIVDLGCGDFSVGAQILTRLGHVRYIGCDVVPEVIEHNRKRYGSTRVQFQTLDIVSEDLPNGDVCVVRQVLQHLSNADIASILPKLCKYRLVYITESQPIARQGKANPDKPASAEVRFDWPTGYGRGVELDLPPWNLSLEEICRAAYPENDKELIITHRVRV
jgi:hypothetical protein